MAEFEPALQLVLSHEGGFVDDKSDEGGATNFGVSLRFYRKRINPDATADDIKRLTIDDASKIYKQYFWDKQPFEQINDQQLCNRLFDLAVNCGSAYAVGMLQKAVNKLFTPKLVVDGQLGPKSINAINRLVPTDLYFNLIEQAKAHYEDLANQGQNHRFLHGWLNRLAN